MKKNLLYIISANVIYLILVAGNNFILPKFTSVETYAVVKEYTLYLTTYGSVLTLGYIQGMYLRYGGKEIDKISPADIGRNIVSFFCLMLPSSIAVSVYGLHTHNSILTILGAGFLCSNLQSYYQMFYQATGDFKSYGVAVNASRVMVLTTNLLLIFFFKTDNKIFYIGASPVIGIAISLYLTLNLNRRIHFFRDLRVSVSDIRVNVKDGFILMLGDFVSRFFSSIDKWFVKYLMTTFSFAMYSFAVSMENLVNTFMTPVTVSMYHYFCKKPGISDIRRIKDLSLIYSLTVIAGAFPCKLLLELFIQNYIPSATVMYLLFASQGISASIRGIYINKYKADGEQKKYLHQMIAMLILSVILNVGFYRVNNSMIAIAAATLTTNVVWLVLCEIQNPDLRYNYRTSVAMIVMLVIYIFAGCSFNAVSGCLIYCVVGLFVFLTLMRESFLYAVNSLLGTFRHKLTNV